MFRRIALLAALTLLTPAVASATASTTTYVSTPGGTTVATCPDVSGGGTADCTIDCTHSPLAFSCSDTSGGCTIIMAETNSYFSTTSNPPRTAVAFREGHECVIVNRSSNTTTIADSSAVQETDGTITIPQWGVFRQVYSNARWVSMAPTGGALTSGAVVATTVTASGIITSTVNPAGTTFAAGALTANPAACATDEVLFGGGVAGTGKAYGDCDGDFTAVKGTYSGVLTSSSQVTSTLNPADTTFAAGALIANPAACATDEVLFGGGVAGTGKAYGDCEGDITGVKGTYGGILTASAGSVFTPSSPNGDTVLTTAACGTDVFIGATADDFTLPAATAGCRIRFIVDANFATTAMTIVTASSANVIFGAIDVNSTLVACAAEDTVTIVESAELPGDFVEFRSNGTDWYVSGMGVTTGSLTCTQAS